MSKNLQDGLETPAINLHKNYVISGVYSSSKRCWSKSNGGVVLVDNLALTRRTRDRFALGVGGSYGQKDYWLSQLDPASPQDPLRCADPEPRVLKSWL